MFQQEEFATALKKEWRSRLTLMQPTVTNTGALARRPRNLGGAAPWLVAVLRGAAWGEESAETLLNEMAEEVDARLEEDAIAAADAVATVQSARSFLQQARSFLELFNPDLLQKGGGTGLLQRDDVKSDTSSSAPKKADSCASRRSTSP